MKTSSSVIVLKLSGRLFFSEDFDPVAKAVRRVLGNRKNLRLAIVSGGGSTAREFISVARKVGTDEASLDEIGIAASRLNAKVFAAALGDVAFSSVPRTLTEIVNLLEVEQDGRRAAVTGGLHPGQSTNAVGALVSEKLRADMFVNATDVDGVYTKDPRKYKDARKLSKVTPAELSRILGEESMQAGSYDLMDPIALKLIERSKIKTWITECKANSIEKALMGKPEGTEVVFPK